MGLEGEDEYIQARLERTRGGLKLLISGQSACCGGEGEKTSVASDQPDGEAQSEKHSLLKKNIKRGVPGPVKRISTISCFLSFCYSKGGNEGSNTVISIVVIELLGELHLLDAREPIPPMLSC